MSNGNKIHNINRPLVSLDEFAANELDKNYAILDRETSYDRAGEFAGLQQGIYSDEDLKYMAARAALAELKDKLESGEASREDVVRLAKFKMQSSREIAKQESREGVGKMAKAGSKGAFMSIESALDTEKQAEAKRKQIPSTRTPFQVRERMVRNSRVPTDLVARWMSTPLEQLAEDTSFPEDLRNEFKAGLRQQHIGPESMVQSGGEGKSAFSDFLAHPVTKTALKFLDTLRTGTSGIGAGYHESVALSDVAREMARNNPEGRRRSGAPDKAYLAHYMGDAGLNMLAGAPVPGLGALMATGAAGNLSKNLFNAMVEDPAQATKMVVTNLLALSDGVYEGYKASKGLWTESGETKSLEKTYGAARATYMHEVKQYLGDKPPEESQEDYDQRVENGFQRLVKGDVNEFAMHHPVLAGVVISSVADPMNYFGKAMITAPFQAAKYTYRGAKMAAPVAKVLGAVEKPIVGAAQYAGEGLRKFTDPLKRKLVLGAYDTAKGMKEGNDALKAMGTQGLVADRIIMAGRDVGGALANKFIAHYALMDDVLAGIKKKEKVAFFDTIEGYGQSSRSSIDLQAEVAKRFDNPKRAKKVEKIVKEYFSVNDDIHKLMAENGLLNDIRTVVDASGKATGHAVFQASKLNDYVPYRSFEGIGDLTEAVNKLGFKDVDSALEALHLIHLQKAKAVSPKQLAFNKAKMARLEKSLDSKGVKGSAITALGLKQGKKLRSFLYKISKGKNHVDIVGQNQVHRVNPVADAARARMGGAKPIKDVRLQWRANIKQLQVRSQRTGDIRELAHGFGVENLPSIANMFAGKSLVNALSSGSTIKVLELAPKLRGAATKDDISSALYQMSDELGVEYTLLSDELAKKFLQVTGTAKDPKKAIVALPKAIALRIEEVIPVVAGPTGKADDFWRVIREELLQPTNEVFRASRTVNRSLAFQAVNLAGAVGIGFMTLGTQALNPSLQAGAARAAFNNAIADSLGGAMTYAGAVTGGVVASGQAFQQDMSLLEIAGAGLAGTVVGAAGGKTLAKGGKLLATKVPKKYRAENVTVKVGDGEAKMSEVLEQLNKYGLVGQSGHRYGSIPELGVKGTGVYARSVNYLSRVHKKAAALTRMQQVAQFGDDYQKTIAFMGYLRKHGKVVGGKISQDSIYKAVDFTSEYAGNYNRLTKFEKTALRDTFAFYSWNRFILPVLTKQMWQNPQRLAAFEKGKKLLEAYVYEQSGETIPSAWPWPL